MQSIQQNMSNDDPESIRISSTPPTMDRRRPRVSSSSSIEPSSPLAYRPRNKRACTTQPIRSEEAHAERMEALREKIRQEEMIQEENELRRQLQELQERNQE